MDRATHSDLIRLARQLALAVQAGEVPGSGHVELCSAVRSAYYALFHLLSRQCADLFAGRDADDRSDSAWLQAYRSLNHGTVRSRCSNSKYITRFPLEVRRYAGTFLQLQEARHSADYDPSVEFDIEDVTTAVEDAEAAMAAFEAVNEKDRRAFAVYVTAPLPR